MKNVALTCVVLVLALSTLGLTSFSSKDNLDDDMVQLKALNAKFIHNFVTNDAASHDKILRPEFVCITSKGKMLGRSEYLEGWKTGFDPGVYLYWDYRNEKITIVGNTALVRSVNKYTIIVSGKETTAMSQYTDIYIKDNGTWKCLQAQITPVAPENYPGDETIVKKYVKGKMM